MNLLPVLEGKATAPIRPYLLTQASGGAKTLLIGQGEWKCLDHRASGGNNYEQGELKCFALPDKAPQAPAQRYDLARDPGETTNRFFENPDLAKELQTVLEPSKTTGRSRP